MASKNEETLQDGEVAKNEETLQDGEVANGQLNQLRNLLKESSIKLWLEPYYNDGTPNLSALSNMAEDLSIAIDLDEKVIADGLRILQQRALDKLDAKELLLQTGRLHLRIKPAKVITEYFEKRDETVPATVRLSKDSTGLVLAQEITKTVQIDPANLRLISGGKVINYETSLDEQDLKPGQAVMVIMIDTDDESMQVLGEQKDALSRTKRDATLLSCRSNPGRYELTITDHTGKIVELPKAEKSAFIIAMSLHEKGKAAMKREDYNLALVMFLEADVEFEKVRFELLQSIDNQGLLNLDIVWCYLKLNSLSQLEDAVDRLQRCQRNFATCHGPNLERLKAVKGGTEPEKALYFRLHLLQAVAHFHSGNPDKARCVMKKVQEEFKLLDIPDESIEEVKAMGFSISEARIALRMCNGKIAKATAVAQRRKDVLAKVRKEEKERQAKWRKYGKTVSGDNVNLGHMETLQDMGIPEDYSVTALKHCDNDIDEAINLIQTQPDVIDVALLSDLEEQAEEEASAGPSDANNDSNEETAAYHRMMAAMGESNEVFDDHLAMDLEEERKLMEQYSSILNM